MRTIETRLSKCIDARSSWDWYRSTFSERTGTMEEPRPHSRLPTTHSGSRPLQAAFKKGWLVNPEALMISDSTDGNKSFGSEAVEVAPHPPPTRIDRAT